MNKRMTTLIFFVLMLVSSVFAEKYRYYWVKETGYDDAYFIVMQLPEELSEERLKSLDNVGGGELNTKKGRLIAEAGLNNIQDYYWAGMVQLVFLDYADVNKEPDMSFINSWGELLEYIRWEK